MQRLCEMCKTIFIAKSPRTRYCSPVCKNKAKLLREKKYNTIYNFDDDSKEEKKENRIVELNEKARSLGLTYGQYMGIEYAKKNPILRLW